MLAVLLLVGVQELPTAIGRVYVLPPGESSMTLWPDQGTALEKFKVATCDLQSSPKPRRHQWRRCTRGRVRHILAGERYAPTRSSVRMA